MSKRASINSINFSGKRWSLTSKYKNKSKSKIKEKRETLRKKQFDIICQKFDFKIKEY